MEIINYPIIQNRFYNRKTIKPTGIVLHSTGDGVPFAKNHAEYFNQPSTPASVHAFIDANTGEVWHCLPWTRWAAHAGGSANDFTVGIEMCEDASIRYQSGAQFAKIDFESTLESTKRTWDSAVSLCVKLCMELEIDPENIWGHGQLKSMGLSVSTHVDPFHIWDYLNNRLGKNRFTIDNFRKEVHSIMSEFAVFNSIDELPSAYTEAVSWFCLNGFLKGDANGNLNLSREMARTLTIVYRAMMNSK